MAGAFASGFQMGGNLYNQAERSRLEQAAEERRATEFAQAQEDRARAVGLREQEDTLRNQLIRPNMENYSFAPTGGQGGLGFQAPAAAQARLPEGAAGLTMPQMGMPSGGEPSFRSTAPAVGLQAPEVSAARQPTFNAAPTGAAAEDILGRMALLKGDTGAYRAAQQAARGFKYEDAYKTATQNWNAMTDAEKGELITKASHDTNIQGFGTWVPGKGKQAGYMNYMAPGNDPIRLSANEAKELYALTTAMEHDPLRARGEMDKVSDKVRLLASQAFEAQSKGVQASNAATHYANADATAAANAATQAGLAGIHGQLYSAQLKGLEDAKVVREKVADLTSKLAEMTVAEQNGPEGKALKTQINAANLKLGGQLAYGPVEKPTPVMSKPQEISWGLLQKSEPWLQAERKGDTSAMNKLLVGRGIDPALIGLPGDAGWVQKQNATPTTPTAPVAPALVQEDRTKYIREKGPRGGYSYTVSPRGLTKAEYKAMDEK